MAQLPIFDIPKGMTCANGAAFLRKVADFAAAGAGSLHVIYDFDRTLTVSHPETQEDVTTWHILGKHLSEAGRAHYQDLFQKYRIIELEDGLTNADAVDWWTASFQLFVDERVNIKQVDADFLARASIRPGVEEVFALCQAYEIPSVIMSAGIRDVIDIWTKKYAINPALVLSTVLKLDSEGAIVGWNEDTLVHVLNKHEAGHEDLTAIRAARPNVIVIGDGVTDADMADGNENVLRIRIFDPRPDEVVDIEAVRQKTFSRFDALIESGTLHPLLKVIEFVAANAKAG